MAAARAYQLSRQWFISSHFIDIELHSTVKQYEADRLMQDSSRCPICSFLTSVSELPPSLASLTL